jgi:hypothetical protein
MTKQKKASKKRNQTERKTLNKESRPVGDLKMNTYLLELRDIKPPCDVTNCPSNNQGYCTTECVIQSFARGKAIAIAALEGIVMDHNARVGTEPNTNDLEKRIKILEKKVAGMSRPSKYDKIVDAAKEICEASSDNCFSLQDLAKNKSLYGIKESFIQQVFQDIYKTGNIFLASKNEHGIERWKFMEASE